MKCLYKYRIIGYDTAGGAEIEKFRKWNLRLTQRETAQKLGINRTTYIDHIKGRTAWKQKDVDALVKMGMKPEWFEANM